MSLFYWAGRHDVFLPEIDAEHRAMFLAGEEAHRALQAGAEPERLREMLHHLLQLAEAHFLHEERLMRDSRFGSLDWHRRQHNAVRERAAALDGAGREAIGEALAYLADWLDGHTAVADRIMAAHVRNWARRRAA